MTADILEPSVELLCEEYVLVQAWKKTSSYIRYHNWYSDTLELDRTTVNLPHFLADLAERLKNPDKWINDPLRMVPAPKSQQWQVTAETKMWEPVKTREKKAAKVRLRPLAHVSLMDQVAATAVMLCLADRVETLQGDPRDSVGDAKKRRNVLSYGNRLFCDENAGRLYHCWGSAKLYRSYYQDYRSFLSRPEIVASAIASERGSRVVIVHSDLKQFYDRVRPSLLSQKIDKLQASSDDPKFYTFARQLLNWQWDKKDFAEVTDYAKQADIPDFSTVALPQGLVAAGFFANVTLLDFDNGLRSAINTEIAPEVRIEDVCRYVDDLRIVLSVGATTSLSEVEQMIGNWLRGLLDQHARGLLASEDKTKAAAFQGDKRTLVRQSRKMMRIQKAISGGFDAIGGEEILNAVQGLIRSQQRYSEKRTDEQGWPFSPIPDVRDSTVARFAAGRFRNTYRSIRPLLPDDESATKETAGENGMGRSRVSHTQSELDDEARAFAMGLIENWVEDPSNVRLLLIGLDIWPSADVLKSVLDLLRPFTEKGGRRKAPRRVAWYCLSEIFRAGATETGIVEDGESMPPGTNITAYRSVLREEAVRLLPSTSQTLPWYLRQQVLLFLATTDPKQVPIIRTGRGLQTRHYRKLIRFLRGDGNSLTGTDFVTLAILSRRSFLGQETAVQLVSRGITPSRLELIAERDPSFAIEILLSRSDLSEGISPRLRDDLCLNLSAHDEGWMSLAEVVLNGAANGPLRNELGILRFASKFLEALPDDARPLVITPVDVQLRLQNPENGFTDDDEVKVTPSRVSQAGSMYLSPPWCPDGAHWRFQLGYLLRFILSARQDFTKIVRPTHWRESTPTYRAPDSHWYQRLYGLFNGHSAFGDDWLPISDWTEQLLFALLRWPGCRNSDIVEVRNGVDATLGAIKIRIQRVAEKQGTASGVLLLPLKTSRPDLCSTVRPLRACVVQTVIPNHSDFSPADLTLSNPPIRRRHRNHLSAALAAIERMLELRKTHTDRDGLDWLILPELSVHPRDVRTHLVPFARAHKTIILAGLTYEELIAGRPLVNSALWIIPIWSAAHGLQILTRRQGKEHLASIEEQFNVAGSVVQGFRPCQWLVGYDWSGRAEDRPLWLTASICYDATDLSLVADIRHHSDVFAIPALNKDVSTFDQMALALHYHMFQYVIVANNGTFGGSNAYAPYRDAFKRQVFHLHGQPQASVAFLEIDDIAAVITRKARTEDPDSPWKSPPAGVSN